MANTFTLISSTILTGTQNTISFTSIPSTYTDLCLKISVRVSDSPTGNVNIKFNSNTSSVYSNRELRGDGSSATSTGSAAGAVGYINYRANGSTTTANTFTNSEIYIPSYTASQNKPFSSMNAEENNATLAYISNFAGLFASTTAISSIDVYADSGINFVSGSSFYLYGIKNS